MEKHLLLFVILLWVSTPLFAQINPLEEGLDAISTNAVKGQLEFLSSDWMEGRETGEKGCFMAADYIASMFKVYGIAPAGDMERLQPSRTGWMRGEAPKTYQTFFQNIYMLQTETGDNHNLSIITTDKNSTTKMSFAYKVDFGISDAKVSVDNEAGVVFAGYGFQDEKSGYNDFENIDIKGKYVLLLRGYPGSDDTLSEGYKKFKPVDRRIEYDRYRSSMEYLRNSGALGVLEVRAGTSLLSGWAANYPFRFNNDIYEGDVQLRSPRKRVSLIEDTLSGSFVQIIITTRTANELLKGSGFSVKEFEQKAASKPEPLSRELKNKRIRLQVNLNSKIIRTQNVVGIVEGEDPSKIIVVGGHYDHLGKINGYIYNGSDDNASGTVGVLSLAKAISAAGVKPKYSIVFAAWTGEEEGLLGSNYFVDHNPIANSKIIANLNYDMISRNMDDDSLGIKCSMSYTKAYKQLEEITNDFNTKYNLGLDIRFRASDRPGGGSDHAPFAEKDIPIFYFMAGFHPDYHQPGDHVEKANIDLMTKIIKLGFLNVWTIANDPAFFEVK